MAITNNSRLGLLTIITKHPGLDAIALKGKGFRPRVHGSLRDAERAGLIEYRNGGWFISQATNAMVNAFFRG